MKSEAGEKELQCSLITIKNNLMVKNNKNNLLKVYNTSDI